MGQTLTKTNFTRQEKKKTSTLIIPTIGDDPSYLLKCSTRSHFFTKQKRSRLNPSRWAAQLSQSQQVKRKA